MQPYIAKGVDPLIFRNSDDAERVKHGLGDVGHFTAIVSAKSNKIGCGRVKDQKLEYKVSSRSFYKIFFIKNGASEALEPFNTNMCLWVFC